MDTMAIEQYAIDAVRDCVNFSDHLPSTKRFITTRSLL